MAKDPRGNTLGRGTRVTLHLKEDAIEMVEQQKIKELVKRYSEYIDFPIYLYVLNKKTKQVPEDEEDEVSIDKGFPLSKEAKLFLFVQIRTRDFFLIMSFTYGIG